MTYELHIPVTKHVPYHSGLVICSSELAAVDTMGHFLQLHGQGRSMLASRST